MANLKLILFCVLQISIASTLVNGDCENMWDNPDSTNMCQVDTVSGYPCSFPFTYNNRTYTTCTIGGPNNPSLYPQCITTANTWSVCLVPNDAVIKSVTTRKSGTANENGASLNGETLVWIYGARFAKNAFSMSPSTQTSSQVRLESKYGSYACEIHTDKTTETQITCWTSAMPEDTYFVRVYVNGNLIPKYQYVRTADAIVKVTSDATPYLNSITPSRGTPGTLLNISGSFNTACYSRDVDECADDNGARITRVYFGPQLCDLINPATASVYYNISSTFLQCQLKGSTVAIFNATMIVSEDNGRSLADDSTYYVTPDESIYNFQTYSEITSISPNSGSTEGGTRLTITGKYLFHSDNIPASIKIGGSKCDVLTYNQNNGFDSNIICQTETAATTATEYSGNRGITVIRDNVYTAFASLSSATPSASATSDWLDVASFSDNQTVDVTVWLEGFLTPQRSANYLFSINSNGPALFYVSTDATAANKQLVASYNSVNTNSTKSLVAGQKYYIQAVASRQKGSLKFDLNAKMFNSTLNGKISYMVKTEVQEIEINSTIIPESTNINYANLAPTTGTSEVQIVTIFSANSNGFILSFDGANTAVLRYGSTGLQVAKALNDLPTIYPTVVTVTDATTANGGKNYTITFDADLGDVPAISELTGNVTISVTEVVKGVPTQNKFQFNVNGAWSSPFDIANDPTANIAKIIHEVFEIRCPVSIQKDSIATTFATFDYETECQFDEKELNLTAFCGKCARKNSDTFFWNVNSPLSYNYICFAYKLSTPIEYIGYNVYIDGDTTNTKTAYAAVTTIADNQWHYTCVDLHQALLMYWGTNAAVYPTYRLTLIGAWLYPMMKDMYIDVVSLKNSLPLDYNDNTLITTRRYYPKLQIVYNSLSVTRASNVLKVSFRPNNCTINLNQSSLRQTVSNIPIATRLTSATGPVTGGFTLQWNGNTLSGFSANSSDLVVKNLLESIPSMGQLNVTRTKDCAGYKWTVEWLSGGDKSPLIVSSNTLSGNAPSIQANVVTDGGVEFYPIQGDMLRTISSQPQIYVEVNGIPSKCSANCDYQWVSALTPAVNSISTSNPSAIVITGTGFDTTLANNVVTIGTTNCAVTAATSTSITCTPGLGPVGTYSFKVEVLGKGYAKMNTATQFTFSLVASSINPTTSGTGGGVTLEVTGTGFSKNSQVLVDSINCPITWYNYTLIRCLVPANPTSTNKLVNVQVNDGSSSATSSQQLTYDALSTPVVSSISKTVLSVMGGEALTILGSNFNVALKQVFIGGYPVTVLNYTSTQINVQTPALAPGFYDLIIPIGSLGYAKSNTQLEYRFYVASFTPSFGSIRGGTLVKVYGEGFNSADCTENQVYFGDYECQVSNCTNQWIQCETTSAYSVYQINNEGVDPSYGAGYKWSTPYLNINKGDTVQWSWSAPGTINDIYYKVEQVSDPSSEIPSGFSSGAPSSQGSFSYQFDQVGVYYYWSGYVDNNGIISFRGVVNVQPPVDKQVPISVLQNNFQAKNCTSCSPLSQPPAQTCPGSNNIQTSCSLPNPTSAYNFIFTNCSIARITSISALNGSAGDSITIQGTGFSSTACENVVRIGSYVCPLTSSSTTTLVCTIGTNSRLLAGTKYQIEVQVKNSGFAIQNTEYSFNFIPIINSISPATGSTAGGTQVTVSGDGFDSVTTSLKLGSDVFINGQNANITYSQIVFVTNSNPSGPLLISVNVNDADGLCKASPNCNFAFSTSGVPTLSSVTPSTVSTATNITIQGSGFGTNVNQLSVVIGSQTCSIISLTNTDIQCSLLNLDLGAQNVIVNLAGIGNAIGTSLKITGQTSIKSISPSSGSINGGTLVTILGNGFGDLSNTVVTIGSSQCTVQSVSLSTITCVTPSGTSGSSSVTISSNGNVFPSLNFAYNPMFTPTITQISPTSGTTNTLITITGTSFGTVSSSVEVIIGTSSCTIVTISNTQITCNTGANIAGDYIVYVKRNNYGYANLDKTFQYTLTFGSLQYTQGSYGGGLALTIIGSGFAGSATTVTICNNPCPITDSLSSTQVTCTVPSYTYSSSDTVCNVNVTVNSKVVTSQFTYKNSLTPTVSSISPNHGGTAGGTLITINGNGFPTSTSSVTVTIANSPCSVTTTTISTITCYTGSYSSSSITAQVMVLINGQGYAISTNTAQTQFRYVDLWSSVFTWGGSSVPQEGELVVIGPGQTIYFDTTTPVLKGVIIQGGSLIFDDNQDVNLNAEYIIVADNGVFQVGTEANPFTHKATITMYGTLRSIELPIYGSKVLAVRNGTLDLHGTPVGVTWTYLNVTAAALSSTITLNDAVSWPVGSKIIIATTGDKLSQGESELRTITAISSDRRTLTLDSPLVHTHLAEKRSPGGVDVYVRAEVGLLSRNVVFNAVNDNTWNPLRTASACPSGFNPGEFATMTCYLGRYGDEIGSDEFGATIMMSGAAQNSIGSESVIARISNVELFHVGQAFRLGRYPIHFHMIGDSPSSYVRECAIRESFNRAVNIHATNYVTVERTVIYNIMGGAFFLEDGIEIGNTFQYNLAVFVKTSSSLLNEDNTPAAFWATNPNNTWQHNNVAGGTHFGYWFRLLDNPDGPSFTPNYCPKKIPLGKFFNNTVHSVGRFGLWIFPGYTPTASGSCWSRTPSPAKFYNLVSYNNDKGAEWVMSTNLQFRNFVVYDNTASGIDTKTIPFHESPNTDYSSSFYNETIGPLVADSVIIGNSLSSTQPSITNCGLKVAWERGELIKNIKFINFPDPNSFAIGATEIAGRCIFGCGGWNTYFTGLSFNNVRYKTLHRWSWDFVGTDLDGSLTGIQNAVVVSATNITSNDSRCVVDNSFSGGMRCIQTKNLIRFSFNNAVPSLPVFIDITNINGNTDVSPQLAKRLTHKHGYMLDLEVNQEYEIAFQQASYPTNISYTGTFYNLYPGEFVIIKHKMNKKPDQVSFFRGVLAQESPSPLSVSNNKNTDWYFDNSTRTLYYILHNQQGKTPFIDYAVEFSAKKCRFVNCQVPTQPALKLPATSRPATAVYWSNESTWSTDGGLVSRGYLALQSGLPLAGDAVKIPDGLWVVVDIPLPKLTRITIEGVLEFNDSLDNTLTADEVFINGGQLIAGWENAPFTHNLQIVLTGTKANTEMILPNGFDTMGTKAIGVYGGLDLHGIPRTSWTQLSVTAKSGTNILNLVQPVDWTVGEQIVISTTTYSTDQAEVFTIASITNNNTITLNGNLVYDHIAMSETFGNGKSYNIAAGVGLLTRNIKIVGDQYATQDADLFGARIIVSDYTDFVYPDNSTTPVLVYYKGYARISDVEIVRGGQFTRADADDYKYQILFSNLGAYNPLRPSYVSNCAFNYGYAAAVGILTSDSIPIENNVIYRTLDYSILLEGNSNIIRNNLIINNIWSSTILTADAPFNKEYLGAIDLSAADSAVIEDNLIAGVERIGINFRGSPCSGVSLGANMNHSIVGNQIYGAFIGVAILPLNGFGLGCLSISEFTVFKSAYWGIYYQFTASVVVDSNTLIDNQVSLFTFVIGPSSKSHVFGTKSVNVTNNVIVGRSPTFDCTKDVVPDSINKNESKIAQSFVANGGGKIGVTWSDFLDGSNGAPFKPWKGIMSYNALNGLTRYEGNTFARFKTQCSGEIDAIIMTNTNNDDGQHPVLFKSTSLYFVDKASKVYIHRPNIGKINPSDCVDMDCDGLKKNLLTDVDGSFLGNPGTVISQSEFEWGSQARGLGDFRIPKDALADINGNRLSPSQIYSNPGIIRDGACSYESDWQGYECYNLDYRILVIESMDSDTETRRLSPVAVISDNGYLDLINGPQDHGWCFGYTCQKRISTFLALVANNHHFDIYLSSTPPDHLRFTIINADANFKIRLAMHYTTTNNVAAYKNINYVPPTNIGTSPKNGATILLDPQGNVNTYKPTITSAPGTNFFYKDEQKVYFSIDGSDYVDLIIQPEIYVKFGVPASTADQMYNSLTLVNNIADLLGVPISMIRRVQIVNETSTTRLLKRSTSTKFIVVVIAEDPTLLSTNQVALNNTLNTLNLIAANITNQAQTNQLQDYAQNLYNWTINTVYIREMPNPSVSTNVDEVELQILSSIGVQQQISGCREQSQCDIQPIVKALDQNNQLITYLGSPNTPWYIKAVIKSTNNPTQLIGSIQAPVVNGYATFDGLTFSNISSGVVLEFSIVTPLGVNSVKVSNMLATSAQFSVGTADVTCKQYESFIQVYNNTQFSVSFGIVSVNTYTLLQNINLNGASWSASIGLYSLSQWQPSGSLTASSTTASFPSNTNNVQFSNLLISTPGMYILKVQMQSSDNRYSISCFSNPVQINSTNITTSFTADFIPNFIFTFTGTYSSMNEGQYKAMMYNYLTNKFNATVVGDIYIWSNTDGTVGVAANVVPNTVVYANVTSYSIESPSSILPGLTLKNLSIYDTTYTAKANVVVGIAPSNTVVNVLNPANTSTNVAAIIGGCVAAAVLAGIASVGGVFLFRHFRAKGRTVGNNPSAKSGKKLLDDTLPMTRQRYVDDAVTKSRDPTGAITEINEVKPPEPLYRSESATISSV